MPSVMRRAPHAPPPPVAVVLGLAAALGAGACRPSRTLVIDSIPPGAIVRLDETVIGRTPLEYRFDHYGERRLSLYAPGYLAHSERRELRAPWHARFPWDLFTEVLLPLGLDHRLELAVIQLQPDDGVTAEPLATEFVGRAGEVREAARRAAEERRAPAPPPTTGAVPPTPEAETGPLPTAGGTTP